MLHQVLGAADERKLRLFAVACFHRVRHLLTDRHMHRAVEVAERHADHLATIEEITAIRNSTLAASSVLGDSAIPTAHTTIEACVRAARIAAWEPVLFPAKVAERPDSGASNQFELGAADADAAGKKERNAQALLLRDILGNPFRPVTIEPAWLSPSRVTLAGNIYHHRAFDRMPILGNTLEGAGCDNSAILDHCRSGIEHVRGCWVVDAIRAPIAGEGRSMSRVLVLFVHNASTRSRIVMLEPWGREFVLREYEKLEVTGQPASTEATLRVVESDDRTLIFVEDCSAVCVIRDGVSHELGLETIAETSETQVLPTRRGPDPMWDRDLDG
jgi:hypothetical protein